MSVLKHFLPFLFCFCFCFCFGLKYLVPTISVISVTDLLSVIRVYKKGSIETLLWSFNTCQLRQLLHGAVTWFCTNFEYNTTKSGFWGKLPLFNVISECFRTRLSYTIFEIFWQWCKNNVDPKVRKIKKLHQALQFGKARVRYKFGASSPSRSPPSHFHQFPMWFTWEKLFPIISALNMFTRSRDVRQWNKTFKNEKNWVWKFEKKKKNPEIRHLPTNHPWWYWPGG